VVTIESKFDEIGLVLIETIDTNLVTRFTSTIGAANVKTTNYNSKDGPEFMPSDKPLIRYAESESDEGIGLICCEVHDVNRQGCS